MGQQLVVPPIVRVAGDRHHRPQQRCPAVDGGGGDKQLLVPFIVLGVQ